MLLRSKDWIQISLSNQTKHANLLFHSLWLRSYGFLLYVTHLYKSIWHIFLASTWPKFLQDDYHPTNFNSGSVKLNLCIHIPLVLIQQADTLLLNWETWFSLCKLCITFGCIITCNWIHFMMSKFQYTKSESKKIIFLPCFAQLTVLKSSVSLWKFGHKWILWKEC